MEGRSFIQRLGSTGPAAAHKAHSLQYAVPSSGRGGPASTSGRGQFTLAPVRAVRLAQRGVFNEAAALHQGGLGLSELLDNDLVEPALTPRRIMNRRIKSCRSVASLSTLVLDEISNFDHQNVSHALSRLAKMVQARTRSASPTSTSTLSQQPQPHQQRRPQGGSAAAVASAAAATARQQHLVEIQPALEQLTRRMHQLIRSYDSWDLTLSLWAYGQLGYHDEAALRVLCEAALTVTPLFKPVDCANAVVAFAYLDFLHTELLRQIVSVMLDTLDDFQTGEVFQVLWGLARLGCHPGDTLLLEVVASVHRHVQEYGTQELVLMLWSLVRLGHKPGVRFLYDVESSLLQRLPHMSPADLSLSVWTFAHLRYKAVRLLDELPAVAGPQLRNCSNAELCSLASGFATAHHYHRVLLDAVAGVIVGRIDSLTHQEVCVVLWTYGTFRHRPTHADFSKLMAATLYGRMPYFAPQGLAMIVKALAQLQWRSEPLLAEIIAAAEARINAFKPLELSQLLWGLSALDCKDLTIYYAVVRRCIAILKDPQHQHYGTMMHHRVVNSVIGSCQQLGYVPWTLIDFAESKGIRVKEPDILSSRDEDDEGMVRPPPPASASSLESATGRDPSQPVGTAAFSAATAAAADSGELNEWDDAAAAADSGARHRSAGAAPMDDDAEAEADGGGGEVGEAEEDLGTSMAANPAGGFVRGRLSYLRRPASKSLLHLQGQGPQDQPLLEEAAAASSSWQGQGQGEVWRQARQRMPPKWAGAAAVAGVEGRPTPLDQHAPLRVGIPQQHPPHGQGTGHGNGVHQQHGKGGGYGGGRHTRGQPDHQQHSSENATGEGPVKVLVPKPRTMRRPAAAGDSSAAAAAATRAANPSMQFKEQGHQQQQRGRRRHPLQRLTSAAAAVGVMPPPPHGVVPAALSPPPRTLSLQMQQQRQNQEQQLGGVPGSNGNGTGNGVASGPRVALER